MGQLFTSERSQPNPEKMQVMVDAPCPNDNNEVQSSVGLRTYYSIFIPDFNCTFALLDALPRKITWYKDHLTSFETIKDIIKRNNIVKYFYINLEHTFEIDASLYVVSVVLLQKQNEIFMYFQFASNTLIVLQKGHATTSRPLQ